MTKNELLEQLENKTLPINDVRKIYFDNKNDKEIVGQTAMNLSLRTSVYDRDVEFSDTMVELLKDIASNPVDMGARWAVAKNPHTPSDILELLSKDSVNLVRALVATNPNTPSETLSKLFHDEKIVKDGLSGNSSTPDKILTLLACDEDRMVRLRVAENPAISNTLLTKLCEDNDNDVKTAADKKLQERNETDKSI